METTKIQKKNMSKPDEALAFDKEKVDGAKIGNTRIGKFYLEPDGVGRNI
ncbi:MAG: hypothetical protein ABJB73_02795 [Candidatus Nitrosocosmicus sp.]